LKKKVAEIHTHGAYSKGYENDYFSKKDLNKWINYLVTPLGTLRKYNPKKPSNEKDKAIQIASNLPFDKKHPNK
jgi:hypothetical protein